MAYGFGATAVLDQEHLGKKSIEGLAPRLRRRSHRTLSSFVKSTKVDFRC